MKIDILTNDGSPLGIIYEDIYGEADRVGLGGAELALLTFCEMLGQEGNSVRLYNNPRRSTTNPFFEQLPLSAFQREDSRDVLIAFRSPNQRIEGAKGFKVWWSCDQYTIGSFKDFAPKVERIVTISPFHSKHFEKEYRILNTIPIDLPVRLDDYILRPRNIPERNPHKALYASVPDRGLMILHAAWPLIQREVPDAELVITSDYRLWGTFALNEQYRMDFMSHPNVQFLGGVKRDFLLREQMTSGVLAYPCTYDELFCISVAEAQVAGCMPITTNRGAVDSTNMYRKIAGNPMSPAWVQEFVAAVVLEMTVPKQETRQSIMLAAQARFAPVRILQEWKEKVFK